MGAIILRGRQVDVPNCSVLQAELRPRLSHYTSRKGTAYKGIILHHDACLSAASCLRVMQRRRVSTHFIVDNDGTIWQLADPLLWRAWSAGRWDQGRIAIDISNACELIYAHHYDPPRDVVTQRIHGALVRWMVPYPCQVEALVALLRVLCREVGIPARVPLTADGKADLRLLNPVPDGIIGHLHCSATKPDPFGLDWPALQRALEA